MHLALVILLAVITVVLVVIAQVYRSVAAIELKRRARQGDSLSKSLYAVAIYGASAQFLLWFLAGLAAAGFFILIDHNTPIWLSLTGSLALIWVGFVWIPRSDINPIGQKIAVILAPVIARLLSYIHPITRHVNRLRISEVSYRHTGIYEKTDLIELLERQEVQADNRIQSVEIDMIRHVLSFNDKLVSDIMIPAKKVVSVAADDLLGPVVLDELHKSGYSHFPVYGKSNKEITGSFNLNKITRTPQEGIKVSSLMDKGVSRVNEESHLSEVLQTLITTGEHLVVVTNNFDEYSGIITSKDVLSELVGKFVTEELSEYEDGSGAADQPEGDGLEIAEPTNDESTELLK